MIHLPERFDDLRPYYDSEIPAAMERIARDPLLSVVLTFIGKADHLHQFQALLRSVTTTGQLQNQVMLPLCRMVVARTIGRYTYEGIENIYTDKGQLFVSNHRDIVMDAWLQQLALFENGRPTSQITFGSNLMDPQFVVDIGLSNKMFKTVRKSDNFEDFLDSSKHLSDYINYVTSHGESVWIAQRNGRTKDGFDRTEPGLLRMLLLGGDKRKALENLNITPVAVSYQWEPCDILKAVELYKSRGGRPYVKTKGEDLNSIVTGITAPKGNVHLTICKPVDLSRYPSVINRSEMTKVVGEMDGKIYAGYKLWDTNYVAYDILNGTGRFAGHYTPELKRTFTDRMESAIGGSGVEDIGTLREIYLKIYAGPVYTKLTTEQ